MIGHSVSDKFLSQLKAVAAANGAALIVDEAIPLWSIRIRVLAAREGSLDLKAKRFDIISLHMAPLGAMTRILGFIVAFPPMAGALLD